MDLITLQEYKDYHGLKKPDEDSKLTMLISSVSALIQTYIGRDYEGGKTVTEVLTVDYDTDTLYLQNYPVDSILEISETSRYTVDSTVHVPLSYGADYILAQADGALIRQRVPGGLASWPMSPGLVTVTYLTGSAGGFETTVPADLKLATIELVTYYSKEEYRQSKTIQGTSQVNTLAQGEDFPKHIQVLLDRYR